MLRESLVAREPYRPLQLHYSVDALVESRPGVRRVRSAPHCRQLSQPHKLSFAEEEGVCVCISVEHPLLNW